MIIIMLCAVYSSAFVSQNSPYWNLPKSLFDFGIVWLPVVLVMISSLLIVMTGVDADDPRTPVVKRLLKAFGRQCLLVVVALVVIVLQLITKPYFPVEHILLMAAGALAILVTVYMYVRSARAKLPNKHWLKSDRKDKAKQAIAWFKESANWLSVDLVINVLSAVSVIVCSWFLMYNTQGDKLFVQLPVLSALTGGLALVKIITRWSEHTTWTAKLTDMLWCFCGLWLFTTAVIVVHGVAETKLTRPTSSLPWLGIILVLVALAPPSFGLMLAAKLKRHKVQHIFNRVGSDERDLRWMITEETFSKKDRLEIGKHLATLGAESLLVALTVDLKDDERVDLAVRRLFDEIPPEDVKTVLSRIYRMSEDTIDKVMERWHVHEHRAEYVNVLGYTEEISQHHKWAPILTQTAQEYAKDGAQNAAITTLTTQQVTMHKVALAYLEDFATVEHIAPLMAAKKGFSINIGLDGDIAELIEHIQVREGVRSGSLSLAEDPSQRGGLSAIEPSGGLSVSDSDT